MAVCNVVEGTLAEPLLAGYAEYSSRSDAEISFYTSGVRSAGITALTHPTPPENTRSRSRIIRMTKYAIRVTNKSSPTRSTNKLTSKLAQGVSSFTCNKTGTQTHYVFVNKTDRIEADPTNLAESRDPRVRFLRLRLLWPGVLLEREQLLRPESLVMNLGRSLDQVLQVSPEDGHPYTLSHPNKDLSALTWSRNYAATQTRNASHPQRLPLPNGFSVRARPCHQ